MTASARILEHFAKSNCSEPIRILGASGQLGYGVPTPAFNAGLERAPHLIGCDMGSIDPGPYYLGSGELATSPTATRRDLRKVLRGALKLNIPLVIGSAGSAGAKPHLDQTLAMVREIASEEGLHFRLGVLRADIDKSVLKAAVVAGGVVSIDDMPALDAQEIDAASNIVGQMGMSAFQRAFAGRRRRDHRRPCLRHRNLCCTPCDGRLSGGACAAHGEDHRMRVAVLCARRPRFHPGNARSRRLCA